MLHGLINAVWGKKVPFGGLIATEKCLGEATPYIPRTFGPQMQNAAKTKRSNIFGTV
jgi:hypothetical protein